MRCDGKDNNKVVWLLFALWIWSLQKTFVWVEQIQIKRNTETYKELKVGI